MGIAEHFSEVRREHENVVIAFTIDAKTTMSACLCFENYSMWGFKPKLM